MPQPPSNLPHQRTLKKRLARQPARMSRPSLHANNSFNQGTLQCINSLLDPGLFGDEIVELFADDGGGDEDFVDGGEPSSCPGVCSTATATIIILARVGG